MKWLMLSITLTFFITSPLLAIEAPAHDGTTPPQNEQSTPPVVLDQDLYEFEARALTDEEIHTIFGSTSSTNERQPEATEYTSSVDTVVQQ